jgi:RNase P subunit RPR2
MKLLKCKECGAYLPVDRTQIIHVELNMLVILTRCYKCNSKNIIETKDWVIK